MSAITSAKTAPVLEQVPSTYFDPKNGLAYPHFKRQLDCVGFVAKQNFSEDPYHIKNVIRSLEDLECFQRNMDHYKNGGTSAFLKILDVKKAENFLTEAYSARQDEWPTAQKVSSAVLVCGVKATTERRINSFVEARKRGYDLGRVFFFVPNKEAGEEIEKLIGSTYSEMFKDFKIIITGNELNHVEKGMKELESNPLFGKDYVIVADPQFARKFESIAKSIFKDRTSAGVAALANKNWKIEMAQFGYGDDPVRFAASEMNIIIRKLDNEFKLLKADTKENTKEIKSDKAA